MIHEGDFRLWNEVVDQVSLKNPAIPVDLSVRARSDRMTTLLISIRVNHRDTGVPCTVHEEVGLPPWQGEEFAVRYVFDRVRRMYEHEAAEAFHYAGARRFDPHVRDRR